ncbi:MAG: methyl-accepting chemotaxis protein [Treponema sp.]|jgi:methyl-accepting chemotaxis protein|nr:methyl-accepting chemotaxis protein [Treponema sp.]
MNSLKTKFFVIFVGLSSVASLSIGLIMFFQYNKYIKQSYEDTLTRVAKMIEKQYPQLADPAALEQEAEALSDTFWELCRGLEHINQSFNMTYIYYMQRLEGKYRYLLSSGFTIDLEDLLSPLYNAEEVGIEAEMAYNAKTMQIMQSPLVNDWGVLISGFLPIVKDGVVVGVLGLDYDISFVQALERRAELSLLIALILTNTGAAFIAFFISASFTTPIKEAELVAESLADLQFDVTIRRMKKDEIGAIQKALLKIRDNLRTTIDNLNEHLLKISTTGKRLTSIVSQSSEALDVIAGSMHSMQTKADSQLQSVAQTVDSVVDIITNIKSLDQAVRTQGTHIAGSSVAIEQMVKNIGSIRSVATHAGETTALLSTSSETGHKKLQRLTEEVERIHTRSAALQNANRTIANIAAQTTILAMNAAIEAAHAGEAGRGFAVVAGEIRKLAELSEKESTAISVEIKAVEEAISRITNVSTETTSTMDSIFQEINAMNRSFSIIHKAVEEQATGGIQILDALKTIQEMTEQVRDGTSVIHQRSDVIHKEVESLKDISHEVRESVHEVRIASNHIAELLDKAKVLAE